MFQRLSLRWKLVLSFTFINVLCTGISIFQWHTSNQVIHNFDEIVEINLKKTRILDRIGQDIQNIHQEVILLGFAQSATVIEQARIKILELENDLLSNNKHYRDLGVVAKESNFLIPMENAAAEFIQLSKKGIDLAKPLDSLEGRKLFADFMSRELKTSYQEALSSFLKMESNLDEATQSLSAEADAAHDFAVNLTFLLLGLSFVTAQVIGQVSSGTLSKSLAQVIGQIVEVNQENTGVGEVLTSLSDQLRADSGKAASSLEETVSSLEELTSMVSNNSRNANEASSISQQSKTSAEEGEAQIGKLIVAMNDMAKGSKKIEEIISVIDDIAFQTNLLALNAAVEAARAGEQGKGFAVVAEAVRHLAQRSAVAAKDIEALIKENVTQSAEGARVARAGGEALNEIVANVKRVSDLNMEISTASQEQATGLQQISQAMNELDRVTQDNAASSEEVASNARTMAQQSELLENLIEDLKTILKGSQASSANSPRRAQLREVTFPRNSSDQAVSRSRDSLRRESGIESRNHKRVLAVSDRTNGTKGRNPKSPARTIQKVEGF